MRIISGEYKGRRIVAPKNLPIRPTTDRAKESLFNILNNHFDFFEISVLDLYTGSGSISYEFASRGAVIVHAVDQNYPVIRFVKNTAKNFNFPILPIKKDALKFIQTTNNQYDIIFADPPYDIELAQLYKLIQIVFERQLLLDNGFLILEHTKAYSFEKNVHFNFSRKYGLTVFSFFKE